MGPDVRYGGFQKLGPLFGSPYVKNPTILGSILGPPSIACLDSTQNVMLVLP